MNQIEIKLSKSKLILRLFGSIVFVILGILFVINPANFVSEIVRSTTFIFCAGLISITFFGFVGLLILRKLVDKSPGLIISDKGITDNSSGVNAGFIPWSDIIAIKETKVVNQKFINIVVKNPDEYIDRQKSSFKKKTMKANYKMFGTAIAISTNALKYDYADLKRLLETKFQEYTSGNI
jgi:hypothetical protein